MITPVEEYLASLDDCRSIQSLSEPTEDGINGIRRQSFVAQDHIRRSLQVIGSHGHDNQQQQTTHERSVTQGHSSTLIVAWATLIVSLVCVKDSALVAAAPTAERPNFIVFIADDMAWDDCGAYGHPSIRTPHLDRLAERGMRFDRAFLTCSSCSPSRCSLITGRYPHNTGASQLHQPLPGDQVTFMEKLKAAGYYTASAGKWHLGRDTIPKLDHVTQKQYEWVKTVEDRPRDKPFCFWFAFVDPHRPYQANAIETPHQPADVRVPPYLPDNPETRRDLAMYYDEIARLDEVVGRVVSELDRQQVSQNTMIVFLSDNGRPFPRCKTTVYDSGIRTPWIVSWPGRVPAGSTCPGLISSIDLAPTLLDLAGVAQPESFQGQSFRPLLEDPQASVRDYVFAEHNWHDFDDHGRAVRDMRYKYIRNYYTDVPGTPPADAVRSPTYQKMLALHELGELSPEQRGCLTVPRPFEELYDLETDPHELHNLAASGEHQKVLNRLRAALDEWEQTTNDHVPAERTPDGFHRVTGDRLKK